MFSKIILGQPHVVPGNIKANLATIKTMTEKAVHAQADLIVFPLDAITGSDLGRLGQQLDFRRDASNARLLLEKNFQHKIQISHTNEYNLYGFSLCPKFLGISPIGKNIFIHGGGSAAYSPDGKLLALGKFFQEDMLELSFDPQHLTLLGNKKTTCETNTEFICYSLLYAIKEFFVTNHIEKVVIGLSGGIDSAVATALFVTALGAENVITVSMPGQYNSELTKKLSDTIAWNLNTRHMVIPITAGTEEIIKILKLNGLPISTLTLENIQARERGGRILSAVAAATGAVVSANSNKAELAVGYSTFYGDLVGAIAPLGDLWKHQIYELGRYINQKIFQNSVLPELIFQIRPSAELNKNQTIGKGGDPLYYPYHDYLLKAFVEGHSLNKIAKWYQDGMLEEKLGCKKELTRVLFKNQHQQFFADLEQWYNAYHGLAVAKRIQAPPIIVVSNHPFGEPEPQIQPYYSEEYLKIKQSILNSSPHA